MSIFQLPSVLNRSFSTIAFLESGIIVTRDMLVLYLALFVIIALSCKLFLKLTNEWCTSPVCLVGKTVIVTGANTGIGYETALDFAKRGAKLIVTCRNAEKGRLTRDRIIDDTDNMDVHYKVAEFESLDSIRRFAQEIIGKETRLDILVNNAGAGVLGNRNTNDGLQVTMQVNYFGPFLLTNLLLDLLISTPSSRIVNVASLAAIFARDLSDLNAFSVGEYYMYCKSKLCNILFTMELASRLKGTMTTTYSLHPGSITTDLFRNVPPYLHLLMTTFYMSLFKKTAIEGAQTTIYCSVQKGIENMSGEHFHNCHRMIRYPNCRDLKLAKKLWAQTDEMMMLKNNN